MTQKPEPRENQHYHLDIDFSNEPYGFCLKTVKMAERTIPRIAINDEPAWTPQLTAEGTRSRRTNVKLSGPGKKLLLIMALAALIVIIVGVVLGNLISTALKGIELPLFFRLEITHYFRGRKCQLPVY